MVPLLVTGFDAFGGMAFNPTEAIVRRLAARPPVDGAAFRVLPTRFDDATREIAEALEAVRPRRVLMLGLARATQGLRLERYAHNRVHSASADNAGVVAEGRAVVTGGPAAYQTAVDADALARDLCAAGIRTWVSADAGGYVCNTVYYTALHWIASRSPDTVGLFVHVPWVHEPVDGPAFERSALDLHEEAARAVIDRFAGRELTAGPNTS